MRQLTVAAGILILVGLLVTRIQRDSIIGSSRAISTAGSIARLKAISNPRFGDDIGGNVLVGFELLSQVPDEYPQVFRLLGAVGSPNRPKQGAVRHHFSRVPGEIDEEIKFFRGQANVVLPHTDGSRRNVNAEVPDFD